MKLSPFMLAGSLLAALSACGSSGQDAAGVDDGSSQQGDESAPSAASAAPSFDCAKAEGEAQDMVCSDADLAAMDRELARLYKLAESGPNVEPARLNELKATQRGWIKGRDECWKASDKRQCVMTSYALRIHELRQGYADARSEDGAGASTGPIALACDGADFGVSATFIQTDPGAVYLQWLENGIALAHVPSGSGAKYEGIWNGEKAELFTQGDDAMLTLPGEAERTCRIEEIG